ncbi:MULTISPECIES: aspartate kinase [Methanothermobacter]|uniref:Aspartokinase n=1 Tax=Methanothermobacter marburgensis (strain ATCC BAA-927 / DSM 2133 / JCM 14651 / NBRC 100331 / OCM 82 / Marburg) TaxID=79929 RepID=D9PX40_METTM|nr:MULTISPECIES: aspartate kinase [Methanothermobacter]ADL58788.1 aspartate kinase [Methanothermobacter marburgensis str. Marburg]MDI9614211.1 aspartate kinase [Methanothermobacter sp.]QHN07408.1 aspartate kinase [Methanothermobacter sp. THM-2]WBF09348.1 aspartate kinase [Methanothermobacter marburgensis]
MELIVAKFGGTSIGNGRRIKKAARSVVKEYMKGKKVVVVVSAINKTTDELLQIVDEAMEDAVTEKQLAEIVSMGEMTSVRIFSSAIEALGVKSEYIDPFMDEWPIITDSNLLNAKVDFEATEKKSKELLKLLDQGIIPVVCGFLGRDPNGYITTLGRGGSDITAFLLGHCLKADEVIIVTDVGGVMSTDPNKLQGAKKLDKISVEEMRDLATHGAQVLHPHALKYKDPDINAKIIGFEHGDLSAPGTEIIGPSKNKMVKTTTLNPEPISVVAVVGEKILNKPGILAKLTSKLAENSINIIGISTGQNSVTIFVDKKDADEAHRLLHDVVIADDNLSSLSLGRDIAMITISSPDFIDTPGIISEITKPLRDNDLNIVEISSSQTSVVIFVDWNDGKKAYELVRGVLE